MADNDRTELRRVVGKTIHNVFWEKQNSLVRFVFEDGSYIDLKAEPQNTKTRLHATIVEIVHIDLFI